MTWTTKIVKMMEDRSPELNLKVQNSYDGDIRIFFNNMYKKHPTHP